MPRLGCHPAVPLGALGMGSAPGALFDWEILDDVNVIKAAESRVPSLLCLQEGRNPSYCSFCPVKNSVGRFFFFSVRTDGKDTFVLDLGFPAP